MARLILAFSFAMLVGCSSSEEATDPVCPTGRLPTEGTACDSARMPTNTFCRLSSCGWGSERECACRDGKWWCTQSSRDDYGCGTPPFCQEKTSLTCPGADAGVDATKTDANDGGLCGSGVPLYAQGPWSTAKSCWPTTEKFFECVPGIDGGTRFTCFVLGGEFFLAPTTQIPSAARACTADEQAAHGAYDRCE